MSALAPSLFISHGAPSMILDPSPAREFLSGLGRQLPRPKAILCISAHWDSDIPRVTAGAQPETIHDFYGFPAPLYAIRYAAPGAPELAARVVQALGAAGIEAATDPARGFDHGCWSPLALAYPKADIPVLQLSVQTAASAAHHAAVGRALAPLRRDGVLVLGSGSATHNLGEMRREVDAPPPDHVRAFDGWLERTLRTGSESELCDWERQAPDARRNHPTVEHFLPLLVAYGAGLGKPGRKLHASFTRGALSLAAYSFH
jgi:4,5-DOPA dioxygenase extradiol